MEGFSCTAFSTAAAYARIVGACPGFTLAIIVNPFAGVFGIADPNFPFSTFSLSRGKAAASGFIRFPRIVIVIFKRARARELPFYRVD
jgi:hypothetical protein